MTNLYGDWNSGTFRNRGGPRKQRLDNKRNFSTWSTAFTEQITSAVVNELGNPDFSNQVGKKELSYFEFCLKFSPKQLNTAPITAQLSTNLVIQQDSTQNFVNLTLRL
jgi:hypothetical protein